jgi:hypothetical protein
MSSHPAANRILVASLGAEFRKLIKASVIDLLQESAPKTGEPVKALTAQTHAPEVQRAQAAFAHLHA